MIRLLLHYNFFFLALIFSCTGLTITDASILTHPEDVTECATNSYKTITFSVTATSKSAAFQWQVYNISTRLWVNLANGSVHNTPAVSGATSNTLSLLFGSTATFLTTHWNGYTVRCRVTIIGINEYSNPATLNILLPPSITMQPLNTSVVTGQSATFTVTATGSNMLYQWRVDKGAVPVNISGATSSAYSIPSTASKDAGSYLCVISNTCNPTGMTSNGALLTITQPPKDKWQLQKNINDEPEGKKLKSSGLSDVTVNNISLTIYPNPFTEVAHIRYTIDIPTDVVIELYNIIGEKVKVLLDESQGAGNHLIELKSSDVEYLNGLYYLKINMNKSVIVKKVLLNR